MQINEHISLAALTTFQTGGFAERFVVVTTEAELSEAVAYARASALPITVLGGGSNVLAPDGELAGLVIKMGIKGVVMHEEGDVVYVTAGAGEEFDAIVAEAVARGYWGLENLSHIPGSIGATPVQNVGAYGVEVGNFISLVRVFDRTTESFTTLSGTDCAFGYRDSRFKHAEGQRYIITAVTFVLSRTPLPQVTYKDLAERFREATPTLALIREAIIEIRSKKFPDWHTEGTAGSFFKNPIIEKSHYDALVQTYPELPGYAADSGTVKVPLGWILDRVLELRGQGSATVGCYEGQALVLYNRGGATTADVLEFAKIIAARVHEATGITIER
jgi:UDP-N-acetylmuramate dehydrogenase